MALPRSLTTVTPFSKYLAMTLFIILPFVGFYLGIQYQKMLTSYYQSSLISTPTMTPSVISPGIQNCTVIRKNANGFLTYSFSNNVYSFEIIAPPSMQCSFSENVNANSTVGIKSLDIVDFHKGQSLEAGGYSGPSFTIQIYPEKGNEQWINSDQSSSDTVSNYVIAATTVKKLSGHAGVRIGPLNHNGFIFTFEIANSDSEKIIDPILSTFQFTNSSPNITPHVSCRPRPACLDATPRCMIAETSDMCPPATNETQPKACSQEAKQCPDGSYVSRTGPNCEFAACPK